MRERRDELLLFFICIFFFSLFFLLPAYPWSEPLTVTCDTFASSATLSPLRNLAQSVFLLP
jgi:hypothetical protein